jgi:hypothetical protein
MEEPKPLMTQDEARARHEDSEIEMAEFQARLDEVRKASSPPRCGICRHRDSVAVGGRRSRAWTTVCLERRPVKRINDRDAPCAHFEQREYHSYREID